MKFQEQYKAEMNSIEPTEAQREKIYAAVYNQINNGEASQPKKLAPSRKKPLPLKTIALAGASAACLILVAGFVIRFTTKNSFMMNAASGGANGGAMPGNSISAPTAEDAAPEGILNDYINKPEADEPQSSESAGVADNFSAISGTPSIIGENARLIFYANCTECILYTDGEPQKFVLTSDSKNLNGGFSFTLPPEKNNLAQTLHITLKNDTIRVTADNQTVIGQFTQE